MHAPTIGEVVSLVRGTTYKSALLGQPGPVLLGLASIQRNGGFRDDSLKTYGGESKSNQLLKPGDLFVSLKDVTQSADLLGAVARVPASVASGRLTQDTVKLDFGDSAYPRNLVYWTLRTPQYRAYCRGHSTGTTNLGLPREDFLAYRLPAPTSDALSLVEALEALDDRIANLRQTNAKLQAIAAALFKSRFVDFDGVPAEDMQELEFGFIPTGWELSRLGNECSYLNRGISPKYIDKGGVLVLNQKCIRDFAIDTTRARRHDPAQRSVEGREIQVGDVLVNSTGVGTLGRVAQVLSINEPSIVDSHVTVVRAGQRLSWAYLGQWFANKQSEIEAMGEGSTGQTELSRSKLAGMPIVVPDRKALADFDAVVAPLKARIVLADSSSRLLTVLRDTLLPRLGKLQLKDAERTTGTAI